MSHHTRPLFCGASQDKRLVFCQKRPVFFQMSHIFNKKSTLSYHYRPLFDFLSPLFMSQRLFSCPITPFSGPITEGLYYVKQVRKRGLYSTKNSPVLYQKSHISNHKTPVLCKSSHVFCQSSAIFYQKSHVLSKEPYIPPHDPCLV